MLGAICAAILSFASKMMHVNVDERIETIQAALPGTNCGACGFPGCSGYASALVKANLSDRPKTNLCTPGGAEVISQISAVLGVESESAITKIAIVRCGGTAETRKKKMDYTGIQTCYAAAQVFGGENACAYGCLGYGDCQTICPSNAICIENGLARINTKLCTGCCLCIKSCPHKIISMERNIQKNFVACSNIERAAAARKRCAKACLGCGKCCRECPEKSITLENNLAKIDYDKCTNCGHCVEICPTKCVHIVSP